MSENEEEKEEEHLQSADFPMTGYEAAEEERRSLENEERNAHVTSLKEEPSPAPANQQKRDEKRGKQRLSATDISMAASAWQVTLFDLDKQLNRQRALMERMADDIKPLRKQFNQVQRDLAKFQKRMEKIRTTPLSTAKRGKRRR
jgi:chromosome segregation ATPase